MRRFYYPEKLSTGQAFTISGSDARHIYKVLRLHKNDIIAMFDGHGHEYECRITGVSLETVEAVVVEDRVRNQGQAIRITLAQGMLKSKKMDTLVRQITELGIARWMPFFCERSVPTPDGARLTARKKRWVRIMHESLKQCRRNRSMEICDPVAYETVLKQGESSDLKIVFWEDESIPLDAACPTLPEKGGSIIVVLGPEGGLSGAEIDLAVSHGYTIASMGPRILRAETAAVSAAVLMQYLFGDMKVSDSPAGEN